MRYLTNSTLSKRQLGIELEINKLCVYIQNFISCLSNPEITVENVIQNLIEDKDFRDIYPEEYLEALTNGYEMDEKLSRIFHIYWDASDKFWITQEEWEEKIKGYLANKREQIEKIKDFLKQFDAEIVESAIAQYDCWD